MGPDDTADDRLDRRWWKEAVVYQVYPRSFNDSDGDGLGDIPGVTERVGYLDALGVDIVWLCPVYDSPMADNGYDIRDYRAIADEFGTMADWEALLSALHDRDMRLIMDLVVNHTSDEHEWFRRSRRGDEQYEDYYYWRDGRPVDEADDATNEGPPGEAPPNNWGSYMGGSAWSYDEGRGQWYLHSFHEKQPDLNWRNPDVRDAVAEMVTWWLEKGIDGFRLDAIQCLSKADGLPDGDPNDAPVGLAQFTYGPRIHEYLRELYERTFANYDVTTVAEMSGTTVEMAADYLGEDGDGLHSLIQFEHMDIDAGPGGRWDPEGWGEWSLPEFKRVLSRWQRADDVWTATYLGNHDQPRIVSRFGDDEASREASAKLLATFLLTTRGTPYVYQGDEIGMTNTDFETLDELDDPMTVGAVEDIIESGAADSYEDLRAFVNYTTRDQSRTPMQWDDSANAGFTDGDPWFPVTDTYREVNVAAARADEDSIWHYYRRAIELRHESPVLVYGDYDLHVPDDEQLFAYTRTLDDERALVVLNWSGERATFDPDGLGVGDARVALANYDDPPTAPVGSEFRPYEAAIYRY
ncbi:glycoside hydrolase family 13 protein [Haloarcula marina]|uniref:glycoside hydrolase family 13 protein n=1 Tax=Haloarcula marina TaxID=2961574 RepID=UPI0020B6EF02|nr:alpha-glucosidase [Halomicroarcula marina]